MLSKLLSYFFWKRSAHSSPNELFHSATTAAHGQNAPRKSRMPLTEKPFAVTVIAGRPAYDPSERHPPYLPTGKSMGISRRTRWFHGLSEIQMRRRVRITEYLSLRYGALSIRSESFGKPPPDPH